LTLKLKARPSIETSGATNLTTQRHMVEDMNAVIGVTLAALYSVLTTPIWRKMTYVKGEAFWNPHLYFEPFFTTRQNFVYLRVQATDIFYNDTKKLRCHINFFIPFCLLFHQK
jgi:hypothetical protein